MDAHENETNNSATTSFNSRMGDLVVDYNSTMFMCCLYVVIGIFAIFCNCLNLTIYYSNKEFRRKFVYFMALDFGELVNGISYILVGTGRGFGLIYGYISTPITVYDCFFKARRYWPHSLILGTELPAYCVILISCERICAVLRPATYNRVFMGQYKIVLLAMVPLLGMTSVTVAGLSTLGAERNRVLTTQHCPIISSSAIWYSTYHFIAITLVYVFAFLSLAIVKWRTRMYAKVRASDSRLGLMLAITGSSILLVGSSAYVMICIRWNIHAYGDITVAITYAMPGFLSICNTILNLSFRKEIRNQLKYLLGMRKQEDSTALFTRMPARSMVTTRNDKVSVSNNSSQNAQSTK